MKLPRRILICLKICMSCAGIAYAQPPVFISPALPPVAATTLAWADYDLDGDPDLFAAGDSAGESWSSLLRNDSSSFTAVVPSLPRVHFASADWGDFDQDGDSDLVVAGYRFSGPITQIWENGGAGSFSLHAATLEGIFEGTLSWQDLDDDGDWDVLQTGFHPVEMMTTRIHENVGGGAFITRPQTGLADIMGGSLSVALVDSDTLPDVILVGQGNPAGAVTQYHRNLGGLQFVAEPFACRIFSEATVEWGDMEGDGDQDLLALGTAEDMFFGLYRYGASGYAEIDLDTSGLAWGCARWCDYDHDGRLDIAACGETKSGLTCRVYHQDGSGTMNELQPSFPLSGLAQAVIAWADWNGDGYEDFAVSGRASDGTQVLKLYTYDLGSNRFKP